MAPPVAQPPPPTDGDSDAGSISTQALSPATNGPVNGDSSDETKVWERPWTIPEIKAAAGNWSLAGDAGLLLHLQDFSHRILSKTHNIEKEVNNLIHEATMTGVRVNNVFNDFIMLANSQFVENRVYDEDISQKENLPPEKKDEELSKEQKEALMLTYVVQAVNFGLDVIDQAFEKLDTNAGNSDSEDEESSYAVDPLFEAKDPYLQRPLPYLIGSGNFMQDDNCGLLEIFSEEDEGETDHGSLSDDSEPEKGKLDQNQSEYTDEDLSSDGDDFLSQKSSRSVTQSKFNDEEEEESDEDLFGSSNRSDNENENYYSEKSEKSEGEGEASKTEEGESEEEEESEEKGNTPEKPQGLMGFQAELANKLGVPPTEPTTTSREKPTAAPREKPSKKKERKPSITSVKSSKSSKYKKKSEEPKDSHSSKESNLPFSPPEEVEDEDSPFGRSGIFSSNKRNLFDDDDEEEGGLFDGIPQQKTSSKQPAVKQPAVKQPTATKDEDTVDQYDDLFSAPPKSAPRKTSQDEKKKKPSKARTLFDDDDDDLFAASAPQTKPVSAKAKAKPAISLFGEEEEEEDLFAQPSIKTEKASEKKLQTGSMFDQNVDTFAAIKKTRPPSDDEDEDDQVDFSDGEKSLDGSIKSIKSSTSISSVNKKGRRSSSQSGNSLFADETDSDLFLSKPSVPASRAKAKVAGLDLFDDEEEEEEADPFTKKNKIINAGGSTETEKDNQEKKSPVSGLFSDGEDDLFAKPKESVKKKPIGGVSLFGDVDIFAKKKSPTEKKEEPKKSEPASAATKQAQRQSTLSLFDDDEEDEEADELFSPLSKPAAGVTPTAPKAPETKPRTKSLFEDEDVLFGTPEENPPVDLFSSEGPLASKKKKSPVPAPSKPKAADAATDLFGDKETKKPEPKKTESSQPASAASTSRTLNIEGVTEGESADSDIPKETKSDAAPPAVKKPIGGVSMFGGVDPFAEMMKKKKAAEAKKEEKEKEEENETSAPKSPVDKSSEESESKSKEPVAPPKARKPLRVESDQHDSANHLDIPRPQPPTTLGTEKLESPGVSFDHPPTPQPLSSAAVTKERARILSRRRPQSRKARRAAAGAEFDSTDFSPISPMTAVPYMNDDGEEGGSFSPVYPIEAMSAPVLYQDKDPFNYKELLAGRTKPSALSTPTQEDKSSPKVSATPADPKDSSSKEPKNTKAASSPIGDDDDLFAGVAKKMPSKKSGDDTDSLFGPSSKSAPSDLKKVNDVTTPKSKSDPAISEKSAVPKAAKKDIQSIDDDDDDDDIFADAAITVNKKKDKKVDPKADDDDDIFASSSVSSKGTDSKDGGSKTAAKKVKTNKTKDEDLFADETDIFSDLPATKQKEKKTPTATKSTSKPLFKDQDIDDIFADSAPSKKKESTTKKDSVAAKKSEKKPSSKKVSSIFDEDDDDDDADDSSLFDDPLSVKSQ